MNTTTKTMVTLTLILLMSNTAAALIETDWAMDRPNEKLHPSDILIDFEDGIQQEWPISDVPGVRFVAYNGFPWVYAEKEFANMNIFPDCWNPDRAYIVNGGYGAFTCWMRIPYHTGLIQIDGGATHVSVLASCDCDFRMSAYDKAGNLIESSGTAEPNAGTLTFTRMTVSSSKANIHTIIFTGIQNRWIIDEVIVGGLEPPTDYGWAAERMRELIGAKYHPFGLGYLLETGQYLTADEIKNNKYPIWNPATKEMTLGEGICPEAAIIWAFNLESNLVNNLGINDMMKKDFKVEIAYEDLQPGDVFFIDYPDWYDEEMNAYMPDGYYDEVGIVIPGQYDQETGMYEDCIRVIPEAGVHYGSTEFINALYGNSGFVHYRSLPDAPKGSKSPYPKIPSKFYI